MPQKWSKEIVVRHILKRHRGGQKLNSGYIQIHCVPLYQAGCKYCGSWRKAIKAAGLKYDHVRVLERACPVWGEEKVIAAIKRRYRLKQPLNSNHIQTKEQRLYGAALKYFGGWAQAIAAAGLDYSKLRKKDPMRSWSKTAIVAEILRRVEQGLSIRGYDVYLEDGGLYHAAKRHFGKGGWAKARVLAGFDPIDPRPWQIWNQQNVREEILQLHESGVALNTGSLQGSSYAYILSAGRVVFGSWAKAIRAAGLNYSKIRKGRKGWWTKSRIIMCIRALEKRGIRLSHNSIRNSHGPLLGSAVVYFGSWSQAVEAAGISYRLHTRVWSTKAWMRRMQEDEYSATLERAKTHARKRRSLT
jgi:hypothetical protein